MIENKPYLSIVSPVYLAEEIVDELVKRIIEEVSIITQDYEILLVEDGSPDESWQRIEKNCEKDKRIKGIKLSRNFGQHYAITAGIKESRGEYVVVMNCDLQDNPNCIIKLLDKAKEGHDVVLTVHKNRKHGIIKNIFSYIFYSVFNFLVGNKNFRSVPQYGAISLITSKVVKAFSSFNDYHRHYLFTILWLGFSKAVIMTEHDHRYAGKSSYTYKKLITFAIDGIISQTEKLLRYSVYVGFSLAIIGFIAIIYIVLLYFYQGYQPGWASIVVLLIFSTGLILISLGIVGVYIGKIFEQTKKRPLYLIDETININQSSEL